MDVSAGTKPVVVKAKNVPSVSTPGSNFVVQCCGVMPYITGLSPYWASPGTSGTLSIAGGNLTGVTQVGVTDADVAIGAPSVAADGFSLTVPFTVGPAAQAGARLVSVWNGLYLSNALSFTVGAPAPQILNVSPSVWPVGPQTPVTVSGVGFGNNPGLLFDDPKVVGVVVSPCLQGTVDTCFQARVTVDPGTALGGTHVAVLSSGIQSPWVPLYYQWANVAFSRQELWQLVGSGSPTPGSGWVGYPVLTAGAGAPILALPNPPDAATLVMNFLVLPNDGAPTQGGIMHTTLQYQAVSGMYSQPTEFNAMAFGMSCYGLIKESDWGTPPDDCGQLRYKGEIYEGPVPTPPGDLPYRQYCKAFLKDLKTQGSGFLADGQKAKYGGTENGQDVYYTVDKFHTFDGPEPQEGATVARDPLVIPGYGVRVDVDKIGNGLHADDAGEAIVGWRLDFFAGLASVCRNLPLSSPLRGNPIQVGSCNPGDVATLSCPSRLPQPPPQRSCPAAANHPGRILK